jgi:DNA polymerase-1
MNLTIIDVSGWIYRQFHGNPNMVHNGVPVGALHGCTGALWSLMKTNPHHIVAVYDHSKTNWRHEIYEAYKANRQPTPDDLRSQIPLIYEAIGVFGVTGISAEGYEADDVIATLADKALNEEGLDVTIVSADKDLMQLVTEDDSIPAVRLYDPLKYTMIGPNEVRAKFGVRPSQMGDLLALWGDNSDNVPGVPGVGRKIGADLLNAYGDLEQVLAAAQTADVGRPLTKSIKSALCTFKGEARLSRRLVALKEDVPVTLDLDKLKVRTPDSAAVMAFLDTHNLETLKETIFGTAAAA